MRGTRRYERGEYVPYGEEELAKLLARIKARVHPWIRLNRVIRDIPSQYVLGGVDAPNLRQVVLASMAAAGERCRCIRCREVGDGKALDEAKLKVADAKLVERRYPASGGDEFFYSFEVGAQETIFGFARLRLPARPTVAAAVRRSIRRLLSSTSAAAANATDGGGEGTSGGREGGGGAGSTKPSRRGGRKGLARTEGGGEGGGDGTGDGGGGGQGEVACDVGGSPFAELVGAALIRELHVYGQLVPTVHKKKGGHSQHMGFGTQRPIARPCPIPDPRSLIPDP